MFLVQRKLIVKFKDMTCNRTHNTFGLPEKNSPASSCRQGSVFSLDHLTYLLSDENAWMKTTDLKRELSSMNSMAESIKRLALSQDGHAVRADQAFSGSLPSLENSSSGMRLETVMSTAKENFNGKYDTLREIGRGGFSVVYQCRNRASGVDYAVKVSTVSLKEYDLF